MGTGRAVVSVNAGSLNKWKTELENAFDNYNANKAKLDGVISAVEAGDISGVPADRFLAEYQKVESFICNQVPNKFAEAIGYLEEQLSKLGKTVSKIEDNTRWG